MKKEVTHALLCIQLLGIALNGATFDVPETNLVLNYEVTNGEVSINGCNSEATGQITIPNEINGFPVTRLDIRAFSNARSIESVNIPENVREIDKFAFSQCYSLESLVVHEENTHFKSYSGMLFDKQMAKLKICPEGKTGSVSIPSGVTTIGEASFMWSSLRVINFPDGILSIEDSAFTYSSIESALLPDSVTSIGYRAFYSCINLKDISLGISLQSIGSEAFRGNHYVDTITVPGSVKSISSYAFSGSRGLKSIVLDEGVEEIGSGAFSNCPQLVNVSLPDSVEEIGASAFGNCPFLINVRLGSGLKKIGSDAFDVDTWSTNEIEQREFLFIHWPSLTILAQSSEALFAVGHIPFPWNQQEILIPDSVEGMPVISISGFDRIRTLMSVKLGNNIRYIGENAFRESTLDNVVLPNGLLEIDDSAFAMATLGSINFEKSIERIGTGSFSNAVIKSDIKIQGNNCVIERGAFGSCYFPNFTKLVIGSGISELGDNAFSRSSGLFEVLIEADLTHIGDGAFAGCLSLKKIELPITLEEVGNRTFQACYDLAEVNFPDGLRKIGINAFEDCRSMTNVDFPNSLTTVGDSSFESCDSLKSARFGSQLIAVGTRAFFDCKELTSVYFSDNLTGSLVIGEEAFSYDDYTGYFPPETHLTDVHFGIGLSYIGARAFKETKIRSAFFPATLETIGNSAFEDCKELRAATFRGRLQAIGTRAFSGCSKLYWLTFDDMVELIGDFAFEDCTKAYFFGDAPLNMGSEVFDNRGFTEIFIVAESAGFTMPEWNGYPVEILDRRPLEATFPNTDQIFWYTEEESGGVGIVKSVTSITGKLTLPRFVDGKPVVSIKDAAFAGSLLDEIVIPDVTVNIGQRAFMLCNNLTKVVFEGALENIGADAFVYCKNLKSVYFANQVKLFGFGVFRECSSLVDINIPEGSPMISERMFSSCTALRHITLPASISSIGQYAFSSCESLVSILFEGDVPLYIATRAFQGLNNVFSFYSYEDKTGFPKPTWYGHTSQTLSLRDDFDGDGFSNADERLLMTSPLDSKDFIRFWIDMSGDNSKVLRYTPKSEKCSVLLEVSDLSQPNAEWIPYANVEFFGTHLEQYAVLPDTDLKALFFRLSFSPKN